MTVTDLNNQRIRRVVETFMSRAQNGTTNDLLYWASKKLGAFTTRMSTFSAHDAHRLLMAAAEEVGYVARDSREMAEDTVLSGLTEGVNDPEGVLADE